MNKEVFNEILCTGLKEMKLKYREKFIEQLYIYMNYLLEENSKYNLTAIDKEEDVINKHFFDSLVLFTKFNFIENTKVIDIGTGAGFPGLVLKLYKPELKVVLVDSLNKRVNFLSSLIKKLNLKDVETLHARAEEIGDNSLYREKFDLAVSRAVASINILSEYTIPLVVNGGSIVYFKGPDYKKEIEGAMKAIKILGGELEEIYKVDIPNIKVERFLIEVKKVEMTPIKYPRRPGIPKKRPL